MATEYTLCGMMKGSRVEVCYYVLISVTCLHGCEQPLIFRYADTKRPRAGEPRLGLAYMVSQLCLFV